MLFKPEFEAIALFLFWHYWGFELRASHLLGKQSTP
jgi:hypothetical protein